MMKNNAICKKTKLIPFIVVMIFSLVCVSGVFAAPTVSSTAGVFSNGQSITINGSGFGANGPNIIFFDDYEKGANGSTFAVGSNTAQIGGYSAALAGATYSNSYKFGGNQAFSVDVTMYPTQNLTIPVPVGTKEIFYSYNDYSPANMPYPGEGNTAGINWKMLWAMGGGSNPTVESPNFVLTMLATSIIYTANNPDVGVIGSLYTGTTYAKGGWNFFSVWHKLGTSNNGGIYITSKNSNTRTTKGSNSSNMTSAASTNDFRKIAIPGYLRQTANCKVYYDDVYVATGPYARARIEIGDASTYANCSKIAIATAATWSDTKVTATLRQGSFKSGDTAYLYIIDANGNVSSGKSITIGSGSSTGLLAPNNLRITAK